MMIIIILVVTALCYFLFVCHMTGPLVKYVLLDMDAHEWQVAVCVDLWVTLHYCTSVHRTQNQTPGSVPNP